jgi:ubiquitin-conjugating enzyme E2 M
MLRFKKPAAAPAAPAAPAPSSGSAVAAEGSAAQEEQSTMDTTEGETTPVENNDEGGEAKVSLVGGIGGVKVAPQKRGKKRTPGELRVQKGRPSTQHSIMTLADSWRPTFSIDIAELDAGKVAEVKFPDPNNLTRFDVEVKPDSGYWVGAKYTFSFVIPDSYPHTPPKVSCSPKIYHPNINFAGNVCLNILREDWKPVLDINAVIYGLIYLFYEPNPDDPLNREAADLFRSDKAQVSSLLQNFVFLFHCLISISYLISLRE